MTIPESEQNHKKVDESWKDQVAKERTFSKPETGPSPSQDSSERPQTRGTPPTGDFGFFISSLSMQTLMALGEIPNPTTNLPEEDLEQAKSLIDILGMLQQKTKGNLSAEEGKMMESILYELRMKFVAKTRKPG